MEWYYFRFLFSFLHYFILSSWDKIIFWHCINLKYYNNQKSSFLTKETIHEFHQQMYCYKLNIQIRDLSRNRYCLFNTPLLKIQCLQ